MLIKNYFSQSNCYIFVQLNGGKNILLKKDLSPANYECSERRKEYKYVCISYCYVVRIERRAVLFGFSSKC